MGKVKYVLFDLDGTITESHPGITRSVEYALKSHGFEPPSLDELKIFVGPPLGEMFMEVYGVSMEKAMDMVKTYRDRYVTIGKFECGVYDGIEETFKSLIAMGKTLCVATSKPESSAKEILEHFGLTKYFTFIGGDSDKHERANKSAVIDYVINELGIDKSEAVMVGDTHYDVEGAKKSGIRCIGVLYGYGEGNKLKEAGAVGLAERPEDIAEMVLHEEDLLL
ncbi:5'-nucleotidase [Clostridiales bacterium]|nr:5'-nucleotidase [Clostridiales bacterium]